MVIWSLIVLSAKLSYEIFQLFMMLFLDVFHLFISVFTGRCYESAVYAITVCSSPVFLSVSYKSVVLLKWLDIRNVPQ